MSDALRCVVTQAPELCKPEHMWTALETAEKVLLGPLGMKTLDPRFAFLVWFYLVVSKQ